MLTAIVITIFSLIGIAVIALMLKGGRSLGATRNLPRDVMDALRRTQPDSRVRKVEARSDGGFDLDLIRDGEPRDMCLVRQGRWTIGSSYDPQATLPASGSYEFLAQEFNLTRDDRLDLSSMDARINSAVQAHLLNKGFALTTAGVPDVRIGYYVVIGGESISGEKGYERGSWILDFVDPVTERILWRGSANADIIVNVNGEGKKQRVNEAVKLILSQYPPRSGAK